MSETDTAMDVLSGKKVYVVEDDPFLGKIIFERLSEAGADAVLIDRGDVAWDEIQKNPPQALLLDIQLPGMDGFQILEGIRNDSKLKTLPVTIISNFNQVKDKERGASLGADYLVKALVTPEDIVQSVRQVFVKK